MMQKFTKTKELLTGVNVLVFLALAYFYLKHWELFFTSDYAMIGLMSFREMFRDEALNIYVWSVGYNGVLFENFMVKAGYLLFGVTPLGWNFFPTLLFGVTLYLFYRCVRKKFSSKVALLAVLLCQLFSPFLQGRVFRTPPNYTQTFFFGFLIFLVWERIKKNENSRPLFLFLWGGMIGFSIYTYGQIYYFLMALFAYEAVNSKLLREKLNELVQKKPWWLKAAFAFFVLNAVLYVAEVDRFSVGGKVLKFSTLSHVKISFLIAILGFVFQNKTTLLSFLKINFKNLGLALLGFFLGYLPEKIYVWSGGTHEYNVTDLQRHFSGLVRATGVFFESMSLIAGSMAGVFLLLLVFTSFFKKNMWKDSGPIPWLLPFVIFGFIGSKMTTSTNELRYLVALVFPLSLGAAVFFMKFWESKKLSLKILSVVFLGVFLVDRSMLQIEKMKQGRSGEPWIRLIDQIQSMTGLSRGYGEYWLSYIPTLLTQEKMIVEPVGSNYGKSYLPLVQEEERVFYLEYALKKNKADLNSMINIHGKEYRVQKEYFVDGSDFEITQDRETEEILRAGGIRILILTRN